MLDRPPSGRVYTTEVRVRLGDVDPSSRLRFDAAARYLQDVSSDDTADVDPNDRMFWVVRRTSIEVRSAPVYRELLQASTWCAGLGSRWAERRVSLVGEHGGSVEASSLWVCVDRRRGRPARLPEDFVERYGVDPSVPRDLEAKLRLPKAPEGQETVPWPLRRTDLDALEHVNNAAYWDVVEEQMAARGLERPGMRGDLEYGAGIDPHEQVEVGARADEEGVLTCWLFVGGTIRATAQVQPIGSHPSSTADGEGATP